MMKLTMSLAVLNVQGEQFQKLDLKLFSFLQVYSDYSC